MGMGFGLFMSSMETSSVGMVCSSRHVLFLHDIVMVCSGPPRAYSNRHAPVVWHGPSSALAR